MEFTQTTLRVLHAVIGAVWLGSVYFSLMVLHRQSPELFDTIEEFEHYVTGLSDGNRWRVLSAIVGTAVTGFGLTWMMMSGGDSSPRLGWWIVMGAKVGALFATAGVFWYVSWRLWPERVFAVGDEIPELQRRGTILRAAMFSLILIGFILGIVAHAL